VFIQQRVNQHVCCILLKPGWPGGQVRRVLAGIRILLFATTNKQAYTARGRGLMNEDFGVARRFFPAPVGWEMTASPAGVYCELLTNSPPPAAPPLLLALLPLLLHTNT
jgi:hypothetical protein